MGERKPKGPTVTGFGRTFTALPARRVGRWGLRNQTFVDTASSVDTTVFIVGMCYAARSPDGARVARILWRDCL